MQAALYDLVSSMVQGFVRVSEEAVGGDRRRDPTWDGPCGYEAGMLTLLDALGPAEEELADERAEAEAIVAVARALIIEE